MKKLVQLTVLFATLFGVASAQNPMVFEPLDAPVDTGEYDKINQKVLLLDGEEILVYFGAFEPIAGYAGTNALYYIDESGKICTFPGAKNFTQVYSVINSENGDILVGTNNGLYMLTTTGWNLQYETYSERITLVYQSSLGGIVYFSERDPVNPDFSCITTMYFVTPDGVIQEIVEKHALIRCYTEFDSIGFAGFSIQPYKGQEESTYSFRLDLATMSERTDLMPPNDAYAMGYYFSGIAYGKYFQLSGQGPVKALQSWDGSAWTEKLFEADSNFNYAGPLNFIGNELYTGPLKITTDLRLEAIPVIGGQMVFGELEWFKNTWYILGQNLSDLPITNVTCSLDSIDIQAYLPSCLARIVATTSVVDIQKESIILYPNPAHDVVHVDKIVDFFIFNQAGQQVSYCLLGNTSFNIENFSPGIYYVLGKDVKGNMVSAQFIVER